MLAIASEEIHVVHLIKVFLFRNRCMFHNVETSHTFVEETIPELHKF